jgi:glutathione synthase/RimK-type ligase-like ATP-grasp enzyme
VSGPRVLLVTRSDDNASVRCVADALRRLGAEPVRLDTDRYPQDVRVSSRLPGLGATLSPPSGDGVERVLVTPGGRVSSLEVGAVWYRRFFAGGRLPATLGDLRRPSVDESRRSLYGFLGALDHVPHMDRLEDVRRCDHKELQLKRAAALGLAIPATLFSNDPDEVRAFHAACGGRVVTKMQSSFAVWRQGQEHVVFTSEVGATELSSLEGLRLCPMVFQAHIQKRIELRATVVDDQVFCAAVDSQRHDVTRLDWRKDGVGLLRAWTPFTLPADTARALVALVRSFGLRYAAADFIVTPDDALVFLEINAGGEWFWLDAHVDGSAGLPIAEAIAAELLRPSSATAAHQTR